MPDKNSEKASIELQRRKVLRTLGASSIVTAGFSGSALGSSGKRVAKAKGKKQSKILRKALTDNETERLLEFASKEDYIINKSEADIFQTETAGKNGRSYYVAVVPLEKETSSDASSRVLMWNNNPDIAHDAVIHELDAKERTESRVFLGQGNKVQVETKAFSQVQKGTTASETVSTTSSDCKYVQEVCTDPNWSCIAAIALSAGACVALLWETTLGGIATCLAEAGVYLMQVMQEENCSICDDTDLREYDTCGSGWQVSPP